MNNLFRTSSSTYCGKISVFIFILLAGLSHLKVHAQMGEVPDKIAPVDAPFPMPQFERPVFPDRTFDIRDFGAKETTDEQDVQCTDAIHKAIEAAYEAGGGKVLIPEGRWLTSPIHLKSNINLHVAESAVVLFSTNKEDYLPVVLQRPEGVEAYNYSPLIYARNLQNIALTGKGILDARGQHWWEWARENRYTPRLEATKVPLSRRHYGKGAGEEGLRPNFAVFYKCKNILVEGITLKDTPMWNIHMVYSNNIIVRDVTVQSLDAPNGDGIVLDSSSDILVEYNHLRTGDDAVVIKSGYNEDGLEVNIPTKNLIVRNFEAIDVRTGSGGIVFGSETSGGIKNVYVHDGYFEGTDRGIRFKTERGRGNIIENIFVQDIIMKDIEFEAINFNTFYSGPGYTGPSPLIRNIHIKNIEIDGVPTAINLIGLPEKWLEDFNFENINVLNSQKGVRLNRVKGLSLKNIQIKSEERAFIAEDVYELSLENITLSDEVRGKPMVLSGDETGVIFLKGGFSKDNIEFGEGVKEDVLR